MMPSETGCWIILILNILVKMTHYVLRVEKNGSGRGN